MHHKQIWHGHMAIDTLYIPAFTLETVFLDKDTGEPLSGGKVEFFRDSQRATQKPVYQITGVEPNYTFTQLPNPMILSSIGTFEDTLGNPVVPYFLPYDGTSIDLYYVTVKSAGDVAQFTREAVPYVNASGSSTSSSSDSGNQIANPQFVEVLFSGNGPAIYNVSGSQVTPVAPGWDLVTSGTGTVTATRLDNLSTTAPSNPPYALQLVSSGLTGTYQLRQRLANSPRLAANQFVGAYFVGSATGSSAAVTMKYVPSSGTSHTLISTTFPATGVITAVQPTNTSITGTINSNAATTGYVDIILEIQAGVTVALSSIQLIPLASSTELFAFEEETSQRQIDHLFHYYKPQLEYKPIQSYLVGWDFPFNPAQFLGDTIAASPTFNVGANKSAYAWDQTIIFQSANLGVSVARTSGGDLQLSAAADCQLALVQYLGRKEARALLSNPLSVNVLGKASASRNFTVSLWYTANTTLPDLNSPNYNSIVLALDTNGYPSSQNNGVSPWVEIPRGKQPQAKGALTTTQADIGFTGWDISTDAAIDTAEYFAIVVGTSALTTGDTVTFSSISLVPGQIPTRPAPKTLNESLADCEYYYEKTYNSGVVPGAVTLNGVNAAPMNAIPSGGTTLLCTSPFSLQWRTEKRVNQSNIVFYNEAGTANALVAILYYNGSAVSSTLPGISAWSLASVGEKYAAYVPNSSSPTLATTAAVNLPSSGYIRFHNTIDARLGIVV